MKFDIKEFEQSLKDVNARKAYEQYLKTIANQKENSITRGCIEMTVEYKDEPEKTVTIPILNTVVRTGKIALAKSLANDVEDVYDFYIDAMLFGTNGASGGVPKYVEETRNGLFGATLISKNVISSIDTAAPTTTILTAVLNFDEGNGEYINEMALRMGNGDLYSMVTFPDFGKTSSMQITFNWYIGFM